MLRVFDPRIEDRASSTDKEVKTIMNTELTIVADVLALADRHHLDPVPLLRVLAAAPNGSDAREGDAALATALPAVVVVPSFFYELDSITADLRGASIHIPSVT